MIPNELKPEFLSLHAINPFVGNVSSSRSTMFYSHFSQHLVIDGATEKRVSTGIEKEVGKYNFNVSMPADGTIFAIVERYPQVMGKENIKNNPETIVIYEDMHTMEFGCFSLPTYCSKHTSFGFEYVKQPDYNQLYIGNKIPKGTVFLDSPARSENGGYKYGIELNMALMSHPACSEDGILISSDVLDKLKFNVYENRIVSFGKEYFPLNLYGDLENYKPFPEIGEKIRSDGVLIALRDKKDILLSPVTMSSLNVLNIDYIFDKATYLRGEGGTVVDIKLHRNITDPSHLPDSVMVNVSKYANALTNFGVRLLEVEKQIMRYKKEKFNTSTVIFKPELQALLVRARNMAGLNLRRANGESINKRVRKQFRKTPIDDYLAEFTVKYTLVPNIGFKMSGSSGDKGVICRIEKPENMPVDAAGNRADIIMDAGSTVNRMNVGRIYEQYFSGVARDITREIRQTLHVEPINPRDHIEDAYTKVQEIAKTNPEVIQQAHDYACKYYNIVSPIQYDTYSKLDWNGIVEHVGDIVDDGIRLFMPTDNPNEPIDMVLEVEKNFKPVYGPVTYIDDNGNKVTTKHPVRIASMYMMVLEKIADDWTSVAYSKLHHFGILTPINKQERNSAPYRNGPVRTIGEVESRIFASYCGRRCIAEMMDRSNNPTTHQEIVKNILNAEKPFNIDNLVDRNKIPYGNTKPLQLLNHVSQCYGWTFKYIPEGVIDGIVNDDDLDRKIIDDELTTVSNKDVENIITGEDDLISDEDKEILDIEDEPINDKGDSSEED